jgi:hypothetical protein
MRTHSITLACAVCGKSFSLSPSACRRGTRCCSRECSVARRHLGRRPPDERFWDKVVRAGPNECWLWQGGKTVGGYGLFCPRAGHSIGAHRFAWQLAHGPIPPDLYVCHRCDRPACCNVTHLFLGTAEDNNHDTIRKGRASRHVPPPMPGTLHPQAKLNEEQVRSILSRPQETRAALAAEFGVSRHTIKAIRSRRVWKHVPMP